MSLALLTKMTLRIMITLITISCVSLNCKVNLGVISMTYLRASMRRAGKTARQLARELGVSEQVVGAWIHGTKSPRADRLPRIAVLLNCTVDDLYRKEE